MRTKNIHTQNHYITSLTLHTRHSLSTSLTLHTSLFQPTQKSNPALKITSDVHNRVWEGEGGTVHVTYADSSTLNLTKFQGKAEEIEEEVFRKAEDVEWEYEQEGKTIE